MLFPQISYRLICLKIGSQHLFLWGDLVTKLRWEIQKWLSLLRNIQGSYRYVFISSLFTDDGVYKFKLFSNKPKICFVFLLYICGCSWKFLLGFLHNLFWHVLMDHLFLLMLMMLGNVPILLTDSFVFCEVFRLTINLRISYDLLISLALSIINKKHIIPAHVFSFRIISYFYFL